MPDAATKPVFEDVKAWPGEAPASAHPGLHHNKPPLEEIIPSEFRAELLRDKPDFLTVLERYLGKPGDAVNDAVPGAVDRADATDDETFGKCGEVVKNLRLAEQHVASVHKSVKEPYLQGGRLVDAEKNKLADRIAAGRSKVEAKMNGYAAQKRAREMEAQRVADEERRRLEALARENNLEQALPPADAAPRIAEPVRSDGGATVSTRVSAVGVVLDHAKAFKAVKTDPKVKEAIEGAVQRLVRAGQREIPGVRIDEQVKALAR